MPFVDRDGVRVYYEAHGSGPAVLLSHGYASTSHMWRGQVEPLSTKHRLILWDMRGHGQTDSPEAQDDYSEEATVEDMAAILRAEGVERAVVGGLSLGGYMSLAFHLAHPEMVRALMLFDTGPGYRNDQAREGWNANSYRRAERFEQRGFEGWREGGEVRPTAHVHGPAGLAKAARGMLAQKDARVITSLPEIRVPTLIVVGANDEPFLAGTDYMEAKIAGSQKVVIPDAGHASNIDQPEAFNAAVLAFLDGLPRE
jgi:pimeloyl-ACP methyl ester carboxylesterase